MLDLEDPRWQAFDNDDPDRLNDLLLFLKTGDETALFSFNFWDMLRPSNARNRDLSYASLPYLVRTIPKQSLKTRIILLQLIGRFACSDPEDCPREFREDLKGVFSLTYEFAQEEILDLSSRSGSETKPSWLLVLIGVLFALRGFKRHADFLLQSMIAFAEEGLSDIQGTCPSCESIWVIDLMDFRQSNY